MSFKPTAAPTFKIYPAVADSIIKIGEKLKAGCSAAEAYTAMEHLIAYAVGQSYDVKRLVLKTIEAAPLGQTSSLIVDGKRVETFAPQGFGGILQARDQARADHLAAVREAIAHPHYQHSRDRDGYVTIYHRDPNSPSGVMAAISGQAQDVNPILRELRNNSPLSPTEGLYAPSKGRY